VLFGEGSEATEQWVKLREGWLWDRHSARLLDDLTVQIKVHRGRKRAALSGLHKYIQDNEEQVRYDEFRATGYDIGSRAVEGTGKYAAGKRHKHSGTIRSRAGSSATLAVRIRWLNRDWDKLWSQKPLAA